MKKKTSTKAVLAKHDDAMRSEYDFSKGVRGKHYGARQNGYTVKIHKLDGTTEVRKISRGKDSRGKEITLEPDVQAYFPDSRSVNRALRALIKLVPNRQGDAEISAARKNQ